MKVFGIILAGGLGRRMGGSAEAPKQKAMILLRGHTLLQHSLARLEPQVDDIAINANGDPSLFLGVSRRPVIADDEAGNPGPLAGVLAGLDHAAERGASHIVTVAVDTPFFPMTLRSRLVEAAEAEGTPLACAKTGERTHPVFGLWPVALAGDLRAAMAEGTRKVDAWTARHGCAEAVFHAEPHDPFFNINTPDDLARAERLVDQ